MKKLAFVLVLLTSVYFGYSQTTFEKTFGSTSFDWGHSVKQTTDGGYIVAGTLYYNLMLSKINANGDTTWVRDYGNAFGEEGYEVVQTSDGNYVVLSHTVWHDWGNPIEKIFLLKVNSIGDTIWTKKFSYGGDGDYSTSFCKTSDNGFVILANSYTSGAIIGYYYIIKINSFGNVQWTKAISSGTNGRGKFIKQTYDGGYIILADSQTNNFLIKTDNLGDTIWKKQYNISAYQVIQSADSGFVIVGKWNDDMCVIKTDVNGNILWNKSDYRPDVDFGKSIYQTSDNGYIIVGSCDIPNIGSGYSNVYLVKTNSLGDTLWTRTFGGQYGDYGDYVQQTHDNGFIFVGGTVNFGAYGFDVYLVKTNAQGLVSGIEDEILKSNTFLIFPNPTNNVINIETDIDYKKVEIYNSLGMKILSTSNKSIDISKQLNGIYLVRFIDKDDNVISTKTVVKY